MVLVHSSPVSLIRDHGRPDNLGVLVSPRGCGTYQQLGEWSWAADNDCFQGLDERRYLDMLAGISGVPGCLFVVVPDVVGDAAATLALWYKWSTTVRATGQPLAFVAQDGLTSAETPWDEIDCLFIGGTTEFKMGPVAASVGREAKHRGKWLHMGRVNTRRRIRYAKSIGCDSIDGTNFSMYRRTNLPWALEWAAAPQQLGFAA